MSNEIMIDIETLGTKDTAVVFQIGYVIFDSKTYKTITEACLDIHIDSQLNNDDFTISADTLKFWTNPSISAGINESLCAANLSMDNALIKLQEEMATHTPGAYWAKGSFDFNILNHQFDTACIQPQWARGFNYTRIRDLRTMMKECGVKPEKTASHNALDDCKYQIRYLQMCRAAIAK